MLRCLISDDGRLRQHGVTKTRPPPARKLQALVYDLSVEEGAEKRRSAECALQAKPNIILCLWLRPVLSQSSAKSRPRRLIIFIMSLLLLNDNPYAPLRP